MKVAICTPCHGDTKARFTLCLSWLLIHTAKADPSIDLIPDIAASSVLPLNRIVLAKRAIAAGADYILWLDADHTFPADTLVRLLAHKLPAVGCNYRARLGRSPTAVAGMPGGGMGMIVTTKESAAKTPLRRVDYMGFGVCLIATDAIRKLEPPLFDMKMLPDGAIGEDVYFFEKLRAAGVTPYIDQKLSLEIGHISEEVLML